MSANLYFLKLNTNLILCYGQILNVFMEFFFQKSAYLEPGPDAYIKKSTSQKQLFLTQPVYMLRQMAIIIIFKLVFPYVLNVCIGMYLLFIYKILRSQHSILVSIVVSIPACHAGDRGSIPRRGDFFSFVFMSLTQSRMPVFNKK